MTIREADAYARRRMAPMPPRDVSYSMLRHQDRRILTYRRRKEGR